MNIRNLWILALSLFPAYSFPQVRPRPSSQPQAPPAYMQQLKSLDQDGFLTRAVFKNNLTVLVSEAHATPLVDFLAWIEAGARDEPADQAGISLVMEHMLWRGTATRNAAALAADLKSLGGKVSSAVLYDHSEFRAVVPATQWKRALEVQADTLLNSSLDPQELKRQIDVIGAEMRDDLSNPETTSEAKLLETGFAGERLGKGLSPSAEALSRITREKLLAFYKSACNPNRLVLIVCGDVTTSEVLNEVFRLYGQAKSGAAPPAAAPAKEPQAGFHYLQARAGDRLAHVNMGFRTAPLGSPDYPALEVLRAMLGTGEGAVFNRRLKHQKGIISRSTVELVGFSDAGYLKIGVDLDPKELDRFELAAFTEFEILKQEDADETEVARARAQLEREYWESSLSVSARADRLARLESIGSWKGASGYLARLRQVKWIDVARVAAKYLRLDNCAMIEVLPMQAETRNLSGETIQGTIKDLLKPVVEQEMAERQKATVPAVDVPEAAAAFKPTEIRYPFQMASILRGPELYIREDHTTPLIHMGIFFAGGKLSEAKANAGITSLLLRAMLSDTKNRSAGQIYRQLELFGGSLTPVVRDDCFGVYFAVSSASIEPGLDLVSDMIKAPKLDPEEVERQKKLQLAAIRSRTDRDLARLRFLETLFKDHPYALDPDGTEESLATITPEAVQVWYRTYVADKKPMVVLVGDTQGTSLAGYFVRNFSGSRFQDVKIPEANPKPLDAKGAVEANYGGGSSVVLLGFQAPPDGDEDYFPLRVLLSYASGLAGRMTDRVRDAVRSAGHVDMEYTPLLRGGSITACLTAAPADEELALKALTEEIQRLATATVTYRDFRSAVNAAVGDVMIRQQNRFAQISDMIRNVTGGRGLEGFQDDVSRLQEVRQADLQEIAQRIFKTDKSVTLRLHGKSTP